MCLWQAGRDQDIYDRLSQACKVQAIKSVVMNEQKLLGETELGDGAPAYCEEQTLTNILTVVNDPSVAATVIDEQVKMWPPTCDLSEEMMQTLHADPTSFEPPSAVGIARKDLRNLLTHTSLISGKI